MRSGYLAYLFQGGDLWTQIKIAFVNYASSMCLGTENFYYIVAAAPRQSGMALG